MSYVLLRVGSSPWRQIGFIQFKLILSVMAVGVVFELTPSTPSSLSPFLLTLSFVFPDHPPHPHRPNSTAQKPVPTVDIVRNYIPDVVVLLATIVTMVTLRYISKRYSYSGAQPELRVEVEGQPGAAEQKGQEMNAVGVPNNPPTTRSNSDRYWEGAHICLDLAIFVVMGACGVVVPSLTSVVYILIFLLKATWWALHLDGRSRLWSVIQALLLVYAGCHLVVVYLYQFEEAQNLIPLQPTNSTVSVLGRWVLGKQR